VDCQSCGERTEPEPHYRRFARTGQAPVCHCGGPLKAATVSFGQALPEQALARAVEGARRADLVLAIGSSLVVEPAASVCLAAKAEGAWYAILNRGRTAHDAVCDLRLDGDVTELLPALVEAL